MVNIIRPLTLILLIFISCSPASSSIGHPKVTNGVLDLRAWDFTANPRIDLEGDWSFKWKEFYRDNQIFAPDIPFRPVPLAWLESNLPRGASGHHGWGTYGLRILLPPNRPTLGLKVPVIGTAFEIQADDKTLLKCGQIGTSKETSKPGWTSKVIEIPTSDTTLDLVIRVSDFHDLTSGLNNTFIFGDYSSLMDLRQSKLLFDFFVLGCLLIMALYHFGLFIFRSHDLPPLFFGLLCFLLSWRGLVYDELFFLQVFPSIDWELFIKLGYWNYALAVGAFGFFIHTLFPTCGWRPFPKVVAICTGLYSLLVALTPVAIYSEVLNYFHLVTLGSCVYTMIVLIRGIIRKEPGARLFLMGSIILFMAVVNDILRTMTYYQTLLMVPGGLLIFILFQSLVMTKKFSFALTAAEKLAAYLNRLNASFERFVPKEILAFLQKKSIADIELGDHIEQHMAVLFIDIRDFTGLSERMSPRENFRFINSYLKRVGPLIRDNKGFVDKYIGDGIMALFPEGPDSAISAALKILDEIESYNRGRSRAQYRHIRLAMGLHYGPLMLGTIGEDLRMDSTVISDTVNLASRMEGIAKQYDLNLVVTESTYHSLKNPKLYTARYIGQEKVKGKVELVRVWAVEGFSPEVELTQ